MGTLVPGQNFDHLLIVISGWDGMHDLQYAASFASGETFNRGALISLDSNGEYVAGLSTNAAMPLWAINATDDFDVNSDVGNVSATGIVGAYVMEPLLNFAMLPPGYHCRMRTLNNNIRPSLAIDCGEHLKVGTFAKYSF